MKKIIDQAKEIEEIHKQSDEWKNKYLRALADYQNLEKRTHTEKEETRKFAVLIFLERLLPVADTLARAQKHLSDSGLGLALKELDAILQEFGVEKIQTLGKPFNPHEMECIEVVEGKENEVVEEALPGFRLHGRVLRVAQVKVGKKAV
ncbi:nucleotide exchange factor GrpE [Candidatus Gottesmanbacteria bacterium]|nr:nucleotide exchange factor GrpE [Candidatus Gottesmanbacteria bacterium]